MSIILNKRKNINVHTRKVRQTMENKCKCCGKEISYEQMEYSTLCGLCDCGTCQQSKRYHELQKRYEELLIISYKKG